MQASWVFPPREGKKKKNTICSYLLFGSLSCRTDKIRFPHVHVVNISHLSNSIDISVGVTETDSIGDRKCNAHMAQLWVFSLSLSLVIRLPMWPFPSSLFTLLSSFLCSEKAVSHIVLFRSLLVTSSSTSFTSCVCMCVCATFPLAQHWVLC